jgi:predicted tellurium resistance membrane protein TerC
MNSIFSLDNLFTLGMLTLLQAVLGFDNLLYISLESKRAPIEKQSMVRRWGIGIAIVLRILLLLILTNIIQYFQDPIINIKLQGIINGNFNLHSIIVLIGGIFILYTATSEILHMMNFNDIDHENRKPQSVKTIISWIVIMNLIFSFDSILSSMALSDVFIVMAIAILISGILMIWLADRVSSFLKRIECMKS